MLPYHVSCLGPCMSSCKADKALKNSVRIDDVAAPCNISARMCIHKSSPGTRPSVGPVSPQGNKPHALSIRPLSKATSGSFHDAPLAALSNMAQQSKNNIFFLLLCWQSVSPALAAKCQGPGANPYKAW
ncbi:hypothetical protein HaLaN_23769 [Haematococcus lacustris]|uniref:Uncharacterized protein n=1 Tax=Haematococcus lacustris TaxID=44745 RepID=A0A699ZSI0_HAELA|nr:hypothetical protein HaLaN_23769 [Haematococcus lacustris]